MPSVRTISRPRHLPLTLLGALLPMLAIATKLYDALRFMVVFPSATYAKSLDLVDWGKMRYNLLGQADHWFPGEHVAKLDIEAAKGVLSNSPFAEQIPGILQEAHSMLHDQEQKRLSESED